MSDNQFQSDIDSLRDADRQIREHIAQIVQDKTRTPAWKSDQVQKQVSLGSQAIELEGKRTVEVLTGQHKLYSKKAYLSPAPSPDDAPRLLITRDVLQERWRRMPEPDIYAAWQSAIESGDKLSAYVYKEFLPRHLNRIGSAGSASQAQRSELAPLAAVVGLPQELPQQYRELAAQTDDLLMNADQRAARKAAQDAQAAAREADLLWHDLAVKLRAVRVTDRGELVDGLYLDAMARARANF